MRRRLGLVGGIALVLSVGMGGCSEDGSSITAVTEAPFFARAPAPGFHVLQRTKPLKRAVSRSRSIGPEGGEVKIGKAGVKIIIPPGALTESTVITVTAPAGRAVAAEFEPHGLRFAKPVELRFETKGTNARESIPGFGSRGPGSSSSPLRGILGVYFEGDPGSGVEPVENFPVFLRGGDIVFHIVHFSGYASATG